MSKPTSMLQFGGISDCKTHVKNQEEEGEDGEDKGMKPPPPLPHSLGPLEMWRNRRRMGWIGAL